MKPLINVRASMLNASANSNKKGNAIIAVMLAMAIIFVAYSTIIQSVVDYKKKVISVKNDLDLRLALNSTMDFVIFGLKQQYCFDSVFMQDANCDLKHPASTERLIMSVDQLNYIKAMIESGAIKDITKPEDALLDSITQTIGLTDVSVAHPLYIIFSQQVFNDIATGVEVKIERDRSLFLPRYGSEVYLNIKVSFVGLKAGALTKWNQSRFTLTSKVSVHPRELGSYALLMTKDLRLDKTHSDALAVGDSAFNQFITGADLAKSYKGLTFLSPVYVNENIHLPYSTAKSYFTPVTFADKVYMGNGAIFKNGVLYKPATTGAADDQYWVGSGEGFGGFLKGVENDGGLDKGLSVFGKVANSVTADYALMKQCLQRSQKNVNNEIVFQNVMTIDTKKFNTTGSSIKSQYQMVLSNGDEFTYQGDELEDSASSKNGWSKSGNNNDPYRFYRKSTPNYGTLLTTTVSLVSSNTIKRVAFDMSTDYKDASSDEYVELKINNSSGYVDSLDQKIANVDKQISIKNNELNKIIADLESLLLGTPTQEQIDDANKKKSDKQKEISALKAKKQEYVDAKNDASNMASNPGKIKMYINNSYNSKDKRERDKLNLNVDIDNEDSIIDDKGDKFNIVIETRGWNLGYYRKRSTYRDDDTGKFEDNSGLIQNFMIGKNSSSDKYEKPSYVSSLPTSATNAVDYAELDALCEEKRSAKTSQAFGSAAYDVDFSPTTRASWNFAGPETATVGQDPVLATLTFDYTNATTPMNSSFQVRSIVGHCVITSSATFVTGFLACDKLTISSRTLPLRIIATIIAGKVEIHPDAFKAGIVWSSIYHPQSTYELRSMGILKPLFGGAAATDCSTASATNINNPIWHPKPSVQFFSNRENCNVISLRAKADPFRWTTVDPDCGLVPGNSNTICKHKLNRFFIFEHSRGNEL